MKAFDYIIVGGGSAGCVLADKLSACGQYNVCLFEAGPKDSSWLIHLPLGVIELMKSKTLNWLYQSTPERSQNNREIFNPRGKTLGGSSSINAMIYIRGQKQDYDHWEALGNQGWSYEDVLPYFKTTQHQERGQDEYHGINGGLNVAESRSKFSVLDDLISAAQQAGHPYNNDFNGEHQEGVGYFQVTQKNGLRCSAAKAFLTPNLNRDNLTIITNVLVEKILIENKQAVGVQYQQHGKTLQLKANREVILSAGSFNSPQLLMLSGIGPKEELHKHNIDVKHPLEGVGKNLQEHVDVLVVNHIKRTDVLAFRPIAIARFFSHIFKFFSNKTGALTSSIAEAGGFIKSSVDINRPDLQLHFIPAAMDDHGRNLKLLCKYGIAIHACLLRPKSRGSVSLSGKNPKLAPKITLNMLSEAEDQTLMIQAIKRVREMLNQPAIKDQLGSEIFPGKAIQSNEDILAFIKDKANTIYHPVGTCKMGNDKYAVVDSELKVHGVENLRVVDASIMPTIVSGNTNAPTIMIGAKAADMILSENK